MSNPPRVMKLTSVRALTPGTPRAPASSGIPGLRHLAQSLPQGITGQPADAVAQAGGIVSPEVARALPRVEGNATPYALQSEQTDLYDLFTTSIGESKEFYVTNRWIKVTLTLQTAGPVVVSTRAEVVPVLSGKGMSLVTGQPIAIVVPRGSRLYYGAASVQRVSVIIEPIPWANEIAGKIDGVVQAISQGAGQVAGVLRSLTRRS